MDISFTNAEFADREMTSSYLLECKVPGIFLQVVKMT